MYIFICYIFILFANVRLLFGTPLKVIHVFVTISFVLRIFCLPNWSVVWEHHSVRGVWLLWWLAEVQTLPLHHHLCPFLPPANPLLHQGTWASAGSLLIWFLTDQGSAHCTLNLFFFFFYERRKARRKKICWTRYVRVLSWVESDVTSLNHLCPAIFKGNCTIITLTIFIYIYIISVVCYETVKLWLWDKNWRHVPFLSSITSCTQFTTNINILKNKISIKCTTLKQTVHTGVRRNYFNCLDVQLLWCFNI